MPDCLKDSEISSVVTTAETGWPFPIGLPIVTMSGTTPRRKRDLSHPMGKPTICIGENKGADQLRSNHEADQRLCFRYSDNTIPSLLIVLLTPKFQASSLLL